ncbi:MAG: hypothetical protein AVDCRST_MAG73-2739 [uncultured Thermomicrobiales bacterium]|uniref:Aminoglycoside phosphotransferase domain-containing protein n=1 Tax=uncultured Thermomicrobiales bacterium TaxID=1645740 RepID=A0A6J4UFM4_9BACT|nr:MAG: hypothetical protein AVDCRST_MAG73-2739 [uncultured Thermomicrobiales bacterium]
MTEPTDVDRFRRLVDHLAPGAALVRSRRLTGGVSATVTALELARGDAGPTTLVVRQHGDLDRRQNPNVARDEFAVLRIAHARGIPVPEPLLLDETGTLSPHPFLVQGYVDGAPDMALGGGAGRVNQAAAQLAAIHAIPGGPELAFLPRFASDAGERPAVLDDALGEGQIRDALDAARSPSVANPPALLHGDYWPGNLLWRNGRLAAVIDWEDARVGDPLADVGNARLEFLFAFGTDAMEALTARYRSLTALDWSGLAYWDLRAALRPCGNLSGWGLDAETERRWRDLHAGFVARALGALPDR